MRVRVYRNLTRGGYSIQDTKNGLVVARWPEVLLSGCKFVVRQGGRNRMLKERVKNVHAFVLGHLDGVGVEDTYIDEMDGLVNRVTYQPYERDYFIDQSGLKVESAEIVLLNRFGIFIQP